ncbi:MAG TPA: SpoIID/LytB domain-containing protein [Vicinamibacterales bacterium]
MSKRRDLVPALVMVMAAVVLLAACASRAPGRPRVAPPVHPFPIDTLRVRLDGEIETIELDEYVAGCVVAELGSVAVSVEAAVQIRDVQAIICRSFAVASLGRHASEGFDVCAATHCQVFQRVPATAIGRLARRAAARTTGQILRAGGAVVRPVYHADCGGHTSSAEEVWGSPGDSYLVAQAEPVCARRPGWQLTLPLARLEAILRDDSRLAVEGRLREVEIAGKDEAGRAMTLRLVGDRPRIVRGNDFRMAVLAALGPQSLRSTLFSLVRQGNSFTFAGRGNGHGVGLCQAGATSRAARGDSAAAILAHYYPGTSISHGAGGPISPVGR